MSNTCIKITETLLNKDVNVLGNHYEHQSFFFYILKSFNKLCEESCRLLCIANWQQVQPSALHHTESREWKLAIQNKCIVWAMHTLPAEDVSSYTNQCQGPGSTDVGSADLAPRCKTYLEHLLTILCWINDSSETKWSIPFVVKSFHFYLILSWREHWFILVDISANFRISNCNSSPFFLTKWLEGHYITKVIAIVVFSWQRL